MTDTAPPQEVLGGLAREDAPVLEAIAKMHLDTLAGVDLDERTYHLVRLAALVSMNAPPASYLVHLGMAADAGVTLEEMQSTLVAIAPIVGSVRVTAAAGNVLRGVGLAAALADET
jgi:alkylhydroperoxidase/carboxymuconolactone decarboxylase family protein YurZ